VDEVLVRRWCDLCRATEEGKRVEAAMRYKVAITRDGAGFDAAVRSVDCCDKHDRQIEELRLLVKSVGGKLPTRQEPAVAPVEPKPRGPAPTAASRVMRTCPVCSNELSATNTTTHLVNVHGAKPIKQSRRCPECSLVAPTDRGMLNHRRMLHGYDYMAELAATINTKGGK
jgi:hypothetical protein